MKKTILISVISSVICCTVFFFVFQSKQKNTIGWVNIGKVFNEFTFKKELEIKLKQTEQTRKAIIDSAEFELRVLTREIKAENGKDKEKITQYEVKRENYLNRKQEFENDNAAMGKQYNEQILTQINQYLKDYGKENSLDYILGADGGGGLMYAVEQKDITEAVIKYINERYKGKIE